MIMTWNRKHIEQLQRDGKIRGWKETQISRGNIPHKQLKNIPPKKTKPLIWLEWNLMYWANERALTLEKEYKFSPDREYRSDWAVPAIKCLIEYEGGIFMMRGAHNSPAAIQRDIDKYALAQQLGFTVIRLTALNYKTAITQLEEYKKRGGW